MIQTNPSRKSLSKSKDHDVLLVENKDSSFVQRILFQSHLRKYGTRAYHHLLELERKQQAKIEKELEKPTLNEIELYPLLKVHQIVETLDSATIDHEFVSGYSCEPKCMKGVNEYESSHLSNIFTVSKIAMDIAHQLDFIHSRGYVHYDVKPQNIIYNEKTNEAKLVDYDMLESFVLCEPYNGECLCEFRKHVKLRGTPNYLCPDLILGHQEIVECEMDIIDLYSFGVSLLVMMVNQPPYPGIKTSEKIYDAIIKGAPPILAELQEMFMDPQPSTQAQFIWIKDAIELLLERDPKTRASKRRQGLEIILKKRTEKEKMVMPIKVKEIKPLDPLDPLDDDGSSNDTLVDPIEI